MTRQDRRRCELIVEYFERQLWQFISIDEWLDSHKEQETNDR